MTNQSDNPYAAPMGELSKAEQSPVIVPMLLVGIIGCAAELYFASYEYGKDTVKFSAFCLSGAACIALALIGVLSVSFVREKNP